MIGKRCRFWSHYSFSLSNEIITGVSLSRYRMVLVAFVGGYNYNITNSYLFPLYCDILTHIMRVNERYVTSSSRNIYINYIIITR